MALAHSQIQWDIFERGPLVIGIELGTQVLEPLVLVLMQSQPSKTEFLRGVFGRLFAKSRRLGGVKYVVANPQLKIFC